MSTITCDIIVLKFSNGNGKRFPQKSAFMEALVLVEENRF